jgi:hypothetical protein
MARPFYFHKVIVILINLFIVGLIIYLVIHDDSDKSPIIFMLFYPLLTLCNLIISLVLRALKFPQSKIYLHSALILAALFIPIIIIISQF